MFTESVRISCSFPSCHGGSAKYKKCLIFHWPTTTLYLDLGSTQLTQVTQKWTQRLEESRAHLIALKVQEGVHDKNLPDRPEAIVDFV